VATQCFGIRGILRTRDRAASLLHSNVPIRISVLVAMGGQASVATIYPGFDQPAVCAGQNVTGKVYLSVIQEDVKCTAIGCRIIGQEFTSVTHTSSDSDGNSSSSTATERRRFMDMRVCLHRRSDTVIRRGHYEFPFNFTMPASAPATMYAGDLSSCGFINYTMEVWLDCPGSLRWDVRNKSTVIVVPVPVAYARTPIYIQPQVLKLRSLSMFNRGNVLLSGQTESNVVYAGETTSLKLAAANSSKISVKAVVIKLTQVATFTALWPSGAVYHGTSVKKLFRTRFTPQQAGLDLAVSLRQQDQETTMRQLGEAVRSDGSSARTPTCTIRIPVPLDAASSYQNGERFLIRHELKIKLVTGFGVCNPWTVLQIYVVNPTPVYVPGEWLKYDKCSPVPQLPRNWTPRIAPLVVLPEIPVDMNAFARPGITLGQEEDRLPFQYAATARAAPEGHPNVGVESSAAMATSAGYAQPTIRHSSSAQAVGAAAGPEGGVSSVATGNTTASAAPAVKFITTTQFVEAVGRSPDPCVELENFLRQGYSVDNLRPNELYWLLHAIPTLADQLRFAEGLARNAKAMTCAKVASVAAGAVEGGQGGQVVEAMLRTGRLQDRENAHLIREQLSDVECVAVEQYLQ
jgi:hypothetical protein